MLTYILEAPWEYPQLCQTNFGLVPQKRSHPLLPSFTVHKLKYADTNLPQCQFYHNKPIGQQNKNIFYYTHTMEIVHKTINNMKSVGISCFHYLNIICGAVLTLTPEILKTYPVSNVSLEQWSISIRIHLLEGMLIPQTVTPTDNVTVHNNPYPTAFPYGNSMVLHFYQQQESSTTKTVHKVINKGLKTYV